MSVIIYKAELETKTVDEAIYLFTRFEFFYFQLMSKDYF
ncbi:unnamed protein product [Brugia timori]|uniref:RGS domain-containing protein n=1 Tax=Brugia timori TaxID=42155 RepID=A0A0R3QNE4_9BILA|nr:unnamed protein product [Brugia timori]